MPVSDTKVVISGNVVETYHYEHPVLYGVTIPKRTRKKAVSAIFWCYNRI